MKKLASILLACLMILSVALVAFAAPEDEFAPSIGEKPAPEVSGSDASVLVVPVSDPSASDDLKNLFEEIRENGNVVSNDELVVRDLFEILPDGEEAEKALTEKGSIQVTLDADLSANALFEVYENVQGAWRKIPAKNNGDGTITITIESFGAIALLVEGEPDLPQTGDTKLTALWISLMLVSFATIQTLIVVYTKKNKKAAATEE